jgi:hypothetical protein
MLYVKADLECDYRVTPQKGSRDKDLIENIIIEGELAVKKLGHLLLSTCSYLDFKNSW